MKKLFFAIATAAMVFATSCSKENANAPEEPVAADNEFICVIDQNANPQNAPAVNDGMGTKAHIDGNNNVWWQAGDKIMYYGNENTQGVNYYELTCSKMSDNRAYFSASDMHFGQGTHVAYYPSTICNNGTLTLPSLITIDPDCNAKHLPMYGTGSGTHYINFHNICAVLKVKVPVACNEIVLSADDDIAGPFSVQGDGDVVPYKAVLATSGCSNTITVSGEFAIDDVVYVAIPEGTYTDVTFELKNGATSLYTTPAKSSMTVTVDKVYSVTITPAPQGGPKFYVSQTKQVEFAPGNLYYDGANWNFESDQVSFPTEWNSNHVGHFYFASTQAAMCNITEPSSTSDLLFQENNTVTVEGETGWYVLSSDEWDYLIDNYHNKVVKLIDDNNCLLIAGENYTGVDPVEDLYIETADDIPAGVLCLPLAGYRTSGGSISDYEMDGSYLSSTLQEDNRFYYFKSNEDGFTDTFTSDNLANAYAIRLVKTVPNPSSIKKK